MSTIQTLHLDSGLAIAAPEATAVGGADGDPLPRVLVHPDGYYWVGLDGHQEFGPYDSVEAAMAAMDADGEDGLGCGETLPEAQSELGLAGWLDPDTGEPAEQTLLHIDDAH